ncbi:helix-turn-helix transcriptional regulator [Gemmiger sp. An194]|uniref:helix-turn-helix domain-containing protein n=1 Tax=Gemmiger sp. An194 TaxID=1965582 RepID=UPI000B36956F|nr:helix-turn-helix transcriptional regulator [Gemmiger sp. An194]OUP23751.1 hypothetical protein B5F28_09610 [Gemmiger sp. An194]
MSGLYETIAQLCANKGITITELCRQSGASRGSLSDLKMGRKQSLSADTLSKIADYFGVSVDYLLGKAESSATNTNNEVGFHVGDTFADGLVTISDVEQQNDGSIKVTYSIDETGLSADDLKKVFLFLKKMYKNGGISTGQVLDLTEQLLILSEAVKNASQKPLKPAKNEDNTPKE